MLRVITIQQACEILRTAFSPVYTSEEVNLSESLGRALSEDIIAREDIPLSDRSMVDGYAVIAADTFGASEAVPALLQLDGEIAMGEMPSKPLKSHSCVRILTGGFIPPDADAAVMLEYADVLPDGTVCIRKPAAPGNHLAFCGDDMRKGQLVFESGRVIDTAELGTLAAMGIDKVKVRKKIKAAVFSTGDEISELAEKISGGRMYDVNRYVIKSLVEKAGGEAVDYGIVPDDENKLRETLSKCSANCDIVFFSGGTSAGSRDFGEKILSEMGEIMWHGLAVKPGKPTIGARVSGKPVIALPGHPLAACLIFMVLGRVAMQVLGAHKEKMREVVAEITESISANDGRELIMPVRLNGEKAEPVRSKSGLITKLSEADGYTLVGRNCEGIHAGEKIKIILF